MSEEQPVIRVVLVDDQCLFRQAIATLVSGQSDMEVVGQAMDGDSGLRCVNDTRPDVVLLDVDMPGRDGVDTARKITASGINTRVVMLTVNDDDNTFLAAIRAGAHGYLLKDLHPTDLFEQIRSAAAGETPIASSLLPRMLDQLRGSDEEPSPTMPVTAHDLSARELEILQLAARGMTNKEIGQRLFITEGTVKNHVHNSLRKLGVENRTQAAAYLNERGLTQRP